MWLDITFMKALILTIILLLTSFTTISQVGVLTLKKGDVVALNMWYTIDDRDRHNNVYITYDNKAEATDKLNEILSELDMDIELPTGKDDEGDTYYKVEQENGFVSFIYLIEDKDFMVWTITIVTAD